MRVCTDKSHGPRHTRTHTQPSTHPRHTHTCVPRTRAFRAKYKIDKSTVGARQSARACAHSRAAHVCVRAEPCVRPSVRACVRPPPCVHVGLSHVMTPGAYHHYFHFACGCAHAFICACVRASVCVCVCVGESGSNAKPPQMRTVMVLPACTCGCGWERAWEWKRPR